MFYSNASSLRFFLSLCICCLGTPPAFAQMALPGSFSVTENGSANYSIPISVVPGTAGIQPKISLDYISGAGNGLVGVGWSLSGLPSILRCGRTIIRDGVLSGINYDVDDRFCLDGERLLAISGTYGADGTEYRLEKEGFSKIVSYGAAGTGPAFFKVWTKAGQILEFGNSPNSRIEAFGLTEVRAWAVNKVSDTAGNYMTVAYVEDGTNGDYRPSLIEYTGNSTGGVNPFASVEFLYESRTDLNPAYVAGSIIRRMERLKGIKAFSGASLVREYRLTYDSGTATERPRLISVELCDSGSSCLPSTNFSVETGGFGWTYANPLIPYIANPNDPDLAYLAGDFNGDGRTDSALASSAGWQSIPTCISTGTAWSCNNPLTTIIGGGSFSTGDFNGDGKTDIVEHHDSWGSYWVCLSTATGTVGGWSCSWWYATFMGGAGGSGNSGYGVYPHGKFVIGDFNGDGRSDIAQVNNTWASIPVCLSTGSGLECRNDLASVIGGGEFSTGDVNGDGKTDIIEHYHGWGSYRMCLANVAGSTGWNCSWWYATFLGGLASGNGGSGVHLNGTFVTGDFNGDGLTDVAQTNNGWGSIPVCLSTGKGLECRNDGATIYPQQSEFYAGDVNGDGKTDILQLGDGFGSIPVCYRSGAGSGWSCRNDLATLHLTGKFLLGDINGDGKTDVFQREAGFGSIPYNLADSSKVDLVNSVTTGLGSVTRITYKSLSESGSPYVRDSGSGYPTVDFQGPVFVVSEVEASNGVGGNYLKEFAYEGAKIDRSGHGFLGFRLMSSTDPQTDIKLETTRRQDWPFVGLTSIEKKILNPDTTPFILNQIDHTYAAGNLGGTRHFVRLTQSLEHSNDLSGAILPSVTTTYQHDGFGNVTQVQVSTADGYSKTTTNTYTNDTVNWFLGRLTRSTVTSVTP